MPGTKRANNLLDMKAKPQAYRDDDTKVSTNDLFNLIENRTDEKRKKLVDKFISALTLHGYAQFHEATGIRKVCCLLLNSK